MASRYPAPLLLAFLVIATVGIQGAARVRQHRAPSRNPIRFELALNNIFFKARINNSRPLWLLLDTGAAASIIDARVARDLHLESSGSASLLGGGGAIKSGIFQGATITIGQRPFKDQTLVIARLNDLPLLVGHPVDGIIGHTLLQNFVLEISYASRTFELHDPQSYPNLNLTKAIPVEFHENSPMISAELSISPTETATGRFIIDTGSTSTLWLARKFVETNELVRRVKRQGPPRFGAGLGGESKVIHARIDRVRIGRLSLARPTIRLSQEQAGIYATMADAGTIGGEILKRFHLVLDYVRGQLLLEPADDFDAPYDEDMSGLDLAAADRHFNSFRILQITPGTPAFAAGLQKGDIITAIDGRPASKFSLDRLTRLLRQSGRSLKLSVRRGKDHFDSVIKLRPLI